MSLPLIPDTVFNAVVGLILSLGLTYLSVRNLLIALIEAR